jgi:hypothetical protein
VALALTALVYRFAPARRSLYAAAAHDHRREVVLHEHRSWKTDRASVEELAAREGVAPAAVFSLAPQGYRLDRAKFCRLAGHLYLHLVYSNGGEEFSLFLSQSDGAAPEGVRGIDLAPERLAVFRTSRIDALVVTDISSVGSARLALSAKAALSL